MTSMVHSKVDIVLPLQVQHNYFIFQISLWQQDKKGKENFDNKHRQNSLAGSLDSQPHKKLRFFTNSFTASFCKNGGK